MDASSLVFTLKENFPQIIAQFNTVQQPNLCSAMLGIPFEKWFVNSSQRTIDIAKLYTEILNNGQNVYLKRLLVNYQDCQINKSDLIFDGEYIEDKNSFSHTTNSWTGNKYPKCGWHLLKKFEIDSITGKIIKACILLINLNGAESQWSKGTISANFSNLILKSCDSDKIFKIWGDIAAKRNNIMPILKDI